MSEANKDLLEKYRKEVALRRKLHEQLVELKGVIKSHLLRQIQKNRPLTELSLRFRQHPCAVPGQACAEGGPA